jgi:hypothetical protein
MGMPCSMYDGNSHNILVHNPPGSIECVYLFPLENTLFKSYIGYMFRHTVNAIFRRFIQNYEVKGVYLNNRLLYCVNMG